MTFPYSFSENDLAWIQASSVLIALIALIVSILAIYFTVKSYRLKRGAFVRGSYGIVSSTVATDHKYVHQITLENLKDRSIVVFAIYIKLARNFYLELETFEDEPIILAPFEVIRRRYDPVDEYSFNNRKLDLNDLFDDTYKRPKIVLSTTDGKLTVKKSLKSWDPVYEWFKNHGVVTAHPLRTTFDGKAYGSNILYLVKLFKDEDLIQTIPLNPRESQYKWFADLGGTSETLLSTGAVAKMFETAIVNEKIKATSVEVVDLQKILKERYQDLDQDRKKAKIKSWFELRVLAKLGTILSERRIRKTNKARNQKASNTKVQVEDDKKQKKSLGASQQPGQ